jgi:hypothetical protein
LLYISKFSTSFPFADTDVKHRRRDRYSLESNTAVTGVWSSQGAECLSRNGARNKQVTCSIPRVAALLRSQQDTSRYLLICTDCRDTDTSADVSYRPTRTVTPSGAPSQSPIVFYKKQGFTACMYQTGFLFNYRDRREKANYGAPMVRLFILKPCRHVYTGAL